MYYVARITIPANTSQNQPVRQSLIVTPGIITKISVQFPPGCCDLARCIILSGETQLYPSSPDTFFSGDTFPVDWSESLVIERNQFTFTIEAWNLDNLYSHTITIGMALVEKGLLIDDYIKRLMYVT